MATISNTPRPAYAWDSTDNVWYPIGTGAHSHNEIDKTTINAKGDLIVGTANDAYTRQAVGADGSVLVADSTQTTGVNWAGPSAIAGKNIAINGGFDVWQRGTSRAFGTVGAFGADRYIIVRSGWAGGATMSRQTGTTDIQYCARVQRDSGNTSTAYTAITCSLESANSIPFAGKTITFSFYARKGANFSEANSYLSYSLNSGTGTDQNLTNTGFTGQTAIFDSVVTLTTSWQRFTFTGTVSSSATQLGYGFSWTPVGTAGANDYFEVTGIQIELGSVATPFTRSGGSAQAELALCQRYYMRYQDGALYSTYVQGAAFNTTTVQFPFQFPVTMRVAPTSFEYGNVQLSDGGTAYSSGSWSIGGGAAGRTITQAIYTHGSAALTTYRPYRLENANNVNGYVAFSAEL